MAVRERMRSGSRKE